MPRHVSKSRRTVHARLIIGLLLGAIADAAQAQSAQKYAFQLAVLSTSIGGNGSGAINGFGVEPQLRTNVFRTEGFSLSMGVGGQYTSHASGGDKLTIAGAFLEPRFVPVLGAGRVFPYLSGRLAVLQQSNNFGSSSGGYAFGAGAGLVVILLPRLNLDAGAQLVRQKFSEFTFTNGSPGSFNPFTTYTAKIGFNYGFPVRR